MARQLVQPNFTVTEIAGWCLRFSDKVFGLTAVYATAWQAWQATKYKHEDRNFPVGVAHPVWFDWTGDVGNGRQQYGHVAIRAADGTIWSSPLTGTGRAWFATVDDLTRAFGNGMKYVGWSEDISNVKVIDIGENMTQDAAEKTVSFAYRASTNADPTKEQASYWVARVRDDPNTVQELLSGLYLANETFRYKATNYDADIKKAEDAATGDFVKLTDIYIKK